MRGCIVAYPVCAGRGCTPLEQRCGRGLSMIRIWGAQERAEAIPLRLPKRLGPAQTVHQFGNAFDVMSSVLVDGGRIDEASIAAGYRHVLSEQQTPVLQLESFVHDREEQRLLLNTHLYPDYVRRVMALTIPGGMTLDALERFRRRRDCVGCTYLWHDHIYGEWRTQGRPLLRRHGTAAGSPVFIEIRQDVFQGEPLLLRAIFHQTLSRA